MDKTTACGCLFLAIVLFLSSCSSRYQVVLNNNVLYSPIASNVTPSILGDADFQGCLNQHFASTGVDDPEQVTLLACPSASIGSLVGIGALPNLEQLELSDNSISDLRPLLSLKKLRVLSIRNNRVTDISPLMSLPLLRFVALQGNNSIDCQRLAALDEKIGNSLNKPENCTN